MEGYTARDVLIVMRLDLTESLQEIESDLAEVRETLEFTGIARQMLSDDEAVGQYPAMKRWLETVSNESDLQRDLDELRTERDELRSALAHLESRLTGRNIS